MQLSHILSPVFFLTLVLTATPVSAEGISVTVEQKSDIESQATWTLLPPTHDKIERNDWKYTMPSLPSGLYTLFVTPPNGTNAMITLSENNTELQKVSHQLSFQATEGQQLHILIENKLVNTGQVGVNSHPSGVPFTLRGPNNWSKKGATPASFTGVPTGNYSVQYEPQGCQQPAAKSDLLLKDGRVDFFIEIDCKEFVPVETPTLDHASMDVEGEALQFVDVPLEEWFTPYILTVVQREILTGYRDERGEHTGYFGPGNPVTLGELSKIAHEVASVNENEYTNLPENPMAKWQWYVGYVASAEKRGWAVYQDPTTDLNRPATRGEVLATLLQALDLPQQWSKGKMFTDVTPRTPHAHAIETFAAAGVVAGSTDESGEPTGLFNPLNPITRAELARVLVNIHEKYLRRVQEEF